MPHILLQGLRPHGTPILVLVCRAQAVRFDCRRGPGGAARTPGTITPSAPQAAPPSPPLECNPKKQKSNVLGVYQRSKSAEKSKKSKKAMFWESIREAKVPRTAKKQKSNGFGIYQKSESCFFFLVRPYGGQKTNTICCGVDRR